MILEKQLLYFEEEDPLMCKLKIAFNRTFNNISMLQEPSIHFDGFTCG